MECLQTRPIKRIKEECSYQQEEDRYDLIILDTASKGLRYTFAHELGHALALELGYDRFKTLAREFNRINSNILPAILGNHDLVEYFRSGIYLAKKRPTGYASRYGFGIYGSYIDTSHAAFLGDIMEMTRKIAKPGDNLDKLVLELVRRYEDAKKIKEAEEETADLFAKIIFNELPVGDPIVKQKVYLLKQFLGIN